MTPQKVVKTFMTTLANNELTSSSAAATKMLDAAVQASSRFTGIQNVIDSMKYDQTAAEMEAVEEVLGSDYAGKTLSDLSSTIKSASAKTYDTQNLGNAYLNSSNDSRTTVERLIKERKAYIFLEKYCGIQLGENYWINSSNGVTSWTGDTSGNVDTGAITGSDANISLAAGDVVYGTTLTADLMTTLAQQDGISLSGDTLIVGTGTEKTENSVVPEIGNLYTATTAQAQSIATGANDWIVLATALDDTISTGGADSIVAGAGNDRIIIGADYASVQTGAGSDTVEIAADVNNVTIEDLDASDIMTISGTFQVGSAQIEDTLLVVTDKTGTRQIRLGDFDTAQNSRVNGTTLATWLSNAGINISNLTSTSSSNEVETLSSAAVETGGEGRIDADDQSLPANDAFANVTDEIQEVASSDATGNISVALGDVTIASGDLEVDGGKVGEISSAFPNISTFTKNGLTVKLLGTTTDKSGGTSKIQTKTLSQLTADQKTIVAGLFKWWAKESLKLNEDSYGISFNSDTATVKEIGLFFYDSQGTGNTLATVWNSSSGGTAVGLKLSVNMNYYSGISADNVDGKSSKTSALLDRTLSHEFTHAVMGANIRYFSSLPQFIKEGSAELTHGIDDERGNRIFGIAYDASRLANVLTLSDTGTGTADAYAGGYMFLRYFAKQAALMELVDYAAPDATATWEISGTTATYKINGTTAATITGLRSGLATKGTELEGVSVSGGVITLSKKLLGTSKVTIKGDGYFLALDDDASDVTITDKKWTVSKGTATLKGDTSAGYALSADAKTITYSAAKTNQTLATVKGLASSGVTASDFSTDDTVITLKSSMLGTSKVTVTGDGYTLALGEGAPTPTLQPAEWALSKTTATYRQETSAGFTLAEDGKSAAYVKATTETLATVSGIKKVTAANTAAIEAALSVDENKVITLGADALGTSKVTVKGDGYTLALGDTAPTPTLQPAEWNLSKTTATYRQETSAGFTLAEDGKSAAYTKAATETLATVSGIKKVTTANTAAIEEALSVDENKVITLGADALGTSKVTVKGDGYTLALGDTAPTPTLQPEEWALSKTTATYRQETSAGFTLAADGKSAAYVKAATETLATVKGIRKVTTANTDEIEAALSVDENKVITLGADALGTSKVTVKGEGYTLALGEGAPTPTLQPAEWNLSKTTATYRQETSAGFTLAEDGKSAAYTKAATETLATVKGIRKVTTANTDEIEAALSVDDDKVITLGADALGTSNVTVTGEGYTLAADTASTAVTTENSWLVKGTAATYNKNQDAYFAPSTDNKKLTYNKATTTNLVTISGLVKGLTVDANGNVSDGDGNVAASVSDTVVTTANADLFGKKVQVTLSDGYTLNNQLAAPEVTKTYWVAKSGKATLKQDITDGYTAVTKKNVTTLTYSAASTPTLTTVSGLDKTLTDTDGALDGLTFDTENKTVTADTRVLTTAAVSVKGNSYTLALADEGDYAVPTATKEATLWEVSGTKAVYKDVKIGYFTRKNTAAFDYKKETVLATHATLSGLRQDASPNSFTLSGDVITLTADALPENPTAATKVSLGKNDAYTLALAEGVANVEYNAGAWSYSKGTASLTATVKTAGYSASDDSKTLTYIPVLDSKGKAVTTTYATLSGVKSASGITLDGTVIKLGAAALNAKKVTLTGEGYTLALADDSLAPTPGDDTWTKSGSKATLAVTYSKGYTVSDDAKTLNYSSKATTATLATISGINTNVDISTFAATDDGSAKTISLTANQLGESVSVSGSCKFDFADSYGYASITGSASDDTIATAGAGLTVTGGKGDDYVDFGGGENVFVYATGDGNDVIADFTATDKIKITKGMPKVASEGSDVIVTVGDGSIKLTGAAGQTISILDSKDKVTTYATQAASADLLLDENYSAAARLSDIVQPASASYSPYDFDTTLNLIKDEDFTPALTCSDKK